MNDPKQSPRPQNRRRQSSLRLLLVCALVAVIGLAVSATRRIVQQSLETEKRVASDPNRSLAHRVQALFYIFRFGSFEDWRPLIEAIATELSELDQASESKNPIPTSTIAAGELWLAISSQRLTLHASRDKAVYWKWLQSSKDWRVRSYALACFFQSLAIEDQRGYALELAGGEVLCLWREHFFLEKDRSHAPPNTRILKLPDYSGNVGMWRVSIAQTIDEEPDFKRFANSSDEGRMGEFLRFCDSAKLLDANLTAAVAEALDVEKGSLEAALEELRKL